MKQTAVEIVENKIEANAVALFDGELTFNEFMYNINKHFNRAKEMEKEQIKDAYIIGRRGGTIKEFNETFKSE